MSFMLKAVNLGLGAISLTKEKAEKFIDEMVEKGEINREDAKQKTLDEVIKKGAEYREEIRTLAREEIDNWRSKCAVVSRADYEKLEQRIKELENKLSKL